MPATHPIAGTPSSTGAPPTIHWTEDGCSLHALWRSERGTAPPKQLVLADDTTSADIAYRQACAGVSMLWRGDFHNARQLLQALARRIDQTPARKRRRATHQTAPEASVAQVFHLHRQAQAQRARILNMVLLEIGADYGIALRRAPAVTLACTQAWGAADPQAGPSVVSLRELLGVTSSHEWRNKGVVIAALGGAPNNRIHPHYGVFSPARGEYIDLVAQATLPVTAQSPYRVFDIGTGTGVLAAVLARRQEMQVVATDLDARALVCARENLQRLDLQEQVCLLQTDLFPPGLASLAVCNPPWLPARPGSPIEHAVYDENGRMLRGFLDGVAAHLAPGGEAWLILSDLAEHLGLRTRTELLAAIDNAGLQLLGRADTRPTHPKSSDRRDLLQAARAAEVTSLWRLSARPTPALVSKQPASVRPSR